MQGANERGNGRLGPRTDHAKITLRVELPDQGGHFGRPHIQADEDCFLGSDDASHDDYLFDPM